MHSKADNCRFRNRRFVSADRGNPNVWGFSGRCKMSLCRAICIAWDFLVTAIIKSPLFTFFNAKCFSQSTQNSLGLALLCSSVGKSDLFYVCPCTTIRQNTFPSFTQTKLPSRLKRGRRKTEKSPANFISLYNLFLKTVFCCFCALVLFNGGDESERRRNVAERGEQRFEFDEILNSLWAGGEVTS